LPALAISFVIHALLMPMLALRETAPPRPLPSAAEILVGIFIAPPGETLLMFPVVKILQQLKLNRPSVVLVTAMLFALAHGFMGALRPLTTFWPFVVFTTILIALWPRSRSLAFVVTSLVHALNNVTAAAILLVASR
jgi:hypothetical protein